ncbi:MAG: DNA gyrase inhibitor YacG [Hyphomonas sp.]|uniref:DNA gyrase inhibitor YacG n=1 Tax=Hyphomonas sp. TaxID=87 RepID=UPI00179C31A2|nr:DNA gyrase inhibitor YacG [Hyphomonas sp.]MBA3070228.1 DNA gyrase inhibitor YacG [Hyphomonas sp.]MBU4062724.1 DNA gyrase inhibitor YacG [Alphaproteobacteria bacterium]MBU4163642.1 DNA gyrase inhibitor YacG [Alphaproteobacteria bacterium]MBU4568886.1 DNA gyrase inhibitor YacG [Alphaproteobacteria bacterium]
MSKPVPPEKRHPKCARCRKQPVLAEYRPFCSKRCADADLGSWLNGSYAIAGSPAEDAEDAPSGAPPVAGEDED